EDLLKHDANQAARYALHANRGMMRIRRSIKVPTNGSTAVPSRKAAPPEADQWLAKGIDDLQRAVDLRPNLYEASIALASAYAHQKEWAKALGCLDEALRRQPNEAGFRAIYFNRARIDEQRLDEVAALADIDRALAVQHDPTEQEIDEDLIR